MILTKRDTFLPYEAMNSKEDLRRLSIKYRGMPFQIISDFNGRDKTEKGILIGLSGSSGSYSVKLKSFDPKMPSEITMNAFHNDWSDIKIDFRGGVKEVRLGEDVPMTQEERRTAIIRMFHSSYNTL